MMPLTLPVLQLLPLLFPLAATGVNPLQTDDPPVTIVILVRDKAHSLPYTLGALERLNYNTSQLSFAFHADGCTDDSVALLHRWRRENWHRYARVEVREERQQKMQESDAGLTPADWTPQRFLHVLRLRQLALDAARLRGSRFAFFLDADAIISHPDTLRHLVWQNQNLIAPLLNCTNQPSFGANFWGDLNPANGFYRRSPDYMDIRRRRKLGLFPVAVVHTAFLLALNPATAAFRFHPVPVDYPRAWPVDDMPLLYAAAKAAGLQPMLDNRLHFGAYATLDHGLLDAFGSSTAAAAWLPRLEAGAFRHILLEFHYHQAGLARLEASPALADRTAEILRPPSRFGFDRIYVINLDRRPDRLARMRYALDILGLKWQLLQAVDGRQLNNSWLSSQGIRQLPGYEDPYRGRGLTHGEIGCFLSHYTVWQEMLVENSTLSRVLVLEDDVRFWHSFEARLELTLAEADRLVPSWELLYLGRKVMHGDEEDEVPGGAGLLVRPAYTYWTLGYALTRPGAAKLVGQRPFDRMIAVDEYLPIMFDRHPNATWKAAFGPRDLNAISAEPLLLEPNYYVGMQGYVSDTEKSAEAIDKSTTVTKCSAEGTTGTCSKPDL